MGTTTKSVRSILQFCKYFTRRLGSTESLFFFLTKGSLKVHTLKKSPAARSAAKLLDIFSAALRAVQHGLYTSNLLPTPMSWSSNSCCFTPKRHKKRSQTPHPSARALCDHSRAHWTPLFKILDPPLYKHVHAQNVV